MDFLGVTKVGLEYDPTKDYNINPIGEFSISGLGVNPNSIGYTFGIRFNQHVELEGVMNFED